MGRARRHLLRLALITAATSAFLWLFLREVDLGEAWGEIIALPLWALAGSLVLVLVNLWVMALRWRYLLEGAGYVVPLRSLFSTISVGRGANNVLPARGGDLVRIESMREVASVPGFVTAGTLFGERVLDGVVFSIFILTGALLIGEEGAMLLTGIALASGSAVGLSLLVLAAGHPDAARGVTARLSGRLPTRWQGGIVREAAHFTEGLRAFADARRLALCLATSAGMWLADVAMFALVGWAFGLGLDPGAYFLLEGIGNLALAVPATAAGLGSFDYLTLVAARGVEAPERVATAYVLTVHAFIVLPVTILGAALVRPALPRVFRRGPAAEKT